MADDHSLPLLNVFDVQEEESGTVRHLVCFLDPVRAGSEGINPKTIVGEMPDEADGEPPAEFHPSKFRLNVGFVESLTQFMNECAAQSEAVKAQARTITTGWLYLLDPRHVDPDTDPSQANLIGAFAVDEFGQIVPNSFLYNENHRFFDLESGLSGVLMNREFYDWLNPKPA